MDGLRPLIQLEAPQRPIPAADKGREEKLRRAEEEVLKQEKALRNREGESTTIYRFSMGPDGKKYISGARVITRSVDEDKTDGAVDERRTLSMDPAQAALLARMAAIERDVIAHEAAHKSVGGQFAGPVSYSYGTGPDGRRYITGGEVSISAPEGRTPEETIEIMEQVKRAALAPASPSGQDLQVAAAAAATQMRARAEMAKQAAQEAYGLEADSPKDEDYSPLSLVA